MFLQTPCHETFVLHFRLLGPYTNSIIPSATQELPACFTSWRLATYTYSIDDVRQMPGVCRAQAPVLFTSSSPSDQPFEWLNIDFKGPLKSNNQNTYFLNVMDEYSRFPFVFPCKDVSTTTVIKCRCQLFSLFGMPAYIHSDRGWVKSFVSFSWVEAWPPAVLLRTTLRVMAK